MSRFSALYPSPNNPRQPFRPRFPQGTRRPNFRQRFPGARNPQPSHKWGHEQFGNVSGFRHHPPHNPNAASSHYGSAGYNVETESSAFGHEQVSDIKYEGYPTESDCGIANDQKDLPLTDLELSLQRNEFRQSYDQSYESYATPSTFKQGKACFNSNAGQEDNYSNVHAFKSDDRYGKKHGSGDHSQSSLGEDMELDSEDEPMSQSVSVGSNSVPGSLNMFQSQGTGPTIEKELENKDDTNPENMISSFAQSLMSNIQKTADCVIRPTVAMPPFHPNSPAEGWSNQKKKLEPILPQKKTLTAAGPKQSPNPVLKSVLKKPKPYQPDQQAIDQSRNKEVMKKNDSSDEEDTGFCKYCNISFNNSDTYWRHTRGMLHTQKLMDYEKKKKDEGKQFFQTDTVNTDPETMESLKDEVPREVKREQFPDQYYCQMCDVKCTGPVTFNMHVAGSKHKSKIGKVDPDQPAMMQKVKHIETDRPAKIKDKLDIMKDPLIGLQYVTEFQKRDERPKYLCNLCESRCDPNSILTHVVGVKHRIRYFKEHYPETYQKMLSYTSRKKSEQNGFAEEFARDIERREGRQEVRVKIEVDTSTEERAADLIKSGALDHLLKGTGLTPDKLKSLKTGIESIQQPQVEGQRAQLPQGQGPNKPFKSALKNPSYNDPSVEGLGQGSLPKRQVDQRLYTDNQQGQGYIQRTETGWGSLPSQQSGQGFDSYNICDQPREDNYGRTSVSGQRPDDPYFSRPDEQYYQQNYPTDYGHQTFQQDQYAPLSKPTDNTSITPSVIMDYGHSSKQNPGDDTSAMKRPLSEDEIMFQEFLMWKKSRMDRNSGSLPPAQQSTVTADNYQYQAHNSSLSTPSVQPTELPNYSTSHQPASTGHSSADLKDIPPQVRELLGTLSKSLIHTEDKASMALTVSNALSEALVQVKAKNTTQAIEQNPLPKKETLRSDPVDKSEPFSAIPGLDMLKQSYEDSVEKPDEEPSFCYASMEKAYKKHFMENAKKYNTYNYLGGETEFEKSRDFIEKLREAREDQSPGRNDENLLETFDDGRREIRETSHGSFEDRSREKIEISHELFDERKREKRELSHESFDERRGGKREKSHEPFSHNRKDEQEGSVEIPTYQERLPHDPYRTGYPYHSQYWGYEHGAYPPYPPYNRYGYPSGYDPYASHHALYGDDRHRREYEHMYYGRDPYRTDRARYNLPHLEEERRKFEEIGGEKRSISPINLENRIVLDYKHNPEKEEKIPAAYKEPLGTGRDRSSSHQRNQSRSSSTSSSSSNSSSTSSSSSSSSSSSLSSSRSRSRSRLVKKETLRHKRRDTSYDKLRSKYSDKKRSTSRENRSRNRSRCRDRGRRRHSRSCSQVRHVSSSHDRNKYSCSRERERFRNKEKEKRDIKSRSSVSIKKDAFDIISKAKTAPLNTDRGSVKVDLSEIILPSETRELKDKPAVKKITLTLKKQDKPVNVGDKVIDMFCEDDSESEEKKDNKKKKTDKTDTPRYSLPLPRELDKAIFDPAVSQNIFKK